MGFVTLFLVCVLQGVAAYYRQYPRVEIPTSYQCPLQLSMKCEASEDVIYYFYPRNLPQLVFTGFNFTLPEHYDSFYPLKVVIHGFGGGALRNKPDPSQAIVKEYTSAGRYNVLAIDYGRLAPPRRPCYPMAVLSSMEVGRCVAVMLSRKLEQHSPRSIHMVGFSLGAHISAYVANHLRSTTGQSIRRITGLDPALPIFAALPNSLTLGKEDADFVDIIHTNAGNFGFLDPIGHVDFYVNDGTHQSGCKDDHEDQPLCNHKLSNVYFAESISSQKGFLATRCSNYLQVFMGRCSSNGQDSNSHKVIMGEYVPRETRGVYSVKTGSRSPFALG